MFLYLFRINDVAADTFQEMLAKYTEPEDSTDTNSDAYTDYDDYDDEEEFDENEYDYMPRNTLETDVDENVDNIHEQTSFDDSFQPYSL